MRFELLIFLHESVWGVRCRWWLGWQRLHRRQPNHDVRHARWLSCVGRMMSTADGYFHRHIDSLPPCNRIQHGDPDSETHQPNDPALHVAPRTDIPPKG